MALYMRTNGVTKKVGTSSPSAIPASNSTYNNTQSGLSADNVQNAIDEINSNLSNKINYAGNFADIDVAKSWFISNAPTQCSMGTLGGGGANTAIFSANDAGYGNIIEVIWNDTARIHFCNNGTWTTKTIQLS